MSELIMLSNVRLSFPHLIEPQKDTTNDGKLRVSYNAEFIMGKDHQGLKQFMNEVSKMAAEKWKDKADNVLQMIGQDRKLRCFGEGSDKVNKKTFKIYDGYENNMYITAGCTTYLEAESSTAGAKRPQIIQLDGSPVDSDNTMAYQQLTRKMYGGCRVNAAVRPWLQENSFGRGVRCDLVAIQFFKDDDAFGEGAPDASNLFGAVAEQPVQQEQGGDMGLPPFMQ
jgi:hypothetical protein